MNKIFLKYVVMVTALLIACTSCVQNDQSDEILTQKQIDDGKIPITVLVKYAFSINGFEKAVEEKFPQVDIIQVGNYTADMGKEEYEARLEHDDLTDIVMTWPLNVGEEYWEDRLIDLAGMDFTGKYAVSMLNDIEKNGAIYYLPGPSQIRGIIYNKTLFEENGWEVSKDFEGFIKLCKEIEDSNIKALQLGFKNKEVLETAFVGYNYGELFSSMEDSEWLDKFNNGQGSFGDHFGDGLDVFKRFVDEGIFTKEDLEISYSEREQMLFTRQCAMVEDSVLMTRLGELQTGTKDEFALMPFFNSGEDNDWARLYMVCYIGLNKNLENQENSKKYQAVLDIMEYISTPEGQEALASDTGGMFSSLQESMPPNVIEIKDLLNALNSNRYATFPEFENAQGALRDALESMILGEVSKKEAIEMIDKQNISPPEEDNPEILGEATKDFSLINTGEFMATRLRVWAETDIGLILDNGKDGKFNGKGVSSRIYKGDITTKDIKRLLPDFKRGEKGYIWKASISKKQLLDVLENSITVESQDGWFYYFSGLKMTYDVTAPPGSRIKTIKTIDGAPLSDDRLYTLAITENSVPREILEDLEITDKTLEQLLTEDIKALGSISPRKENFLQLG